jgi:transposase
MAPACTAAARPTLWPWPARPPGHLPMCAGERDLVRAVDRLPVAGRADCYPHGRTVHHHFACWAADGTLGRLHDVLRGRVRAAAGRTVAPTAAVIDSQSVRASDWVWRATKGYDAAKKVHGRKRQVAVDTCGLLLEILITRQRARPRWWPAAAVAPSPRPADHPAGVG